MLSVNTNVGSMVALQNLNTTEAQLLVTENQQATGLKVASAADNGAVFAIAQNLRGSVAGYTAVQGSLNQGISTISVALSAGQSISDLLTQMQGIATQAADPSQNTAARQALNATFTADRDTIASIIKNAKFQGFNLLDGSTKQIQALASADGSSHVTTSAQTFSLGGKIISVSATATITTQTSASTMIKTLQNSVQNVNKALANLSAGSAKFSITATFISKLTDTLNAGIGNLVNANPANVSANLAALQTKQQLNIQALSIANQAPQAILSLFR